MARPSENEVRSWTRQWRAENPDDAGMLSWHSVYLWIENSHFDRVAGIADHDKYSIEEWIKSELRANLAQQTGSDDV